MRSISPEARTIEHCVRARGGRAQKAGPKPASLSVDGGRDQAKRSVLFLRRYASQPSPRKPRISMAQVEGSGTAPTVIMSVPQLGSCGSSNISYPTLASGHILLVQ